jgi:hypothetical protein
VGDVATIPLFLLNNSIIDGLAKTKEFQKPLSIYQAAAISIPWVTENWGS